NGSLQMDSRTVVVMDEAGMADTYRLSTLMEMTAQRQSKLVLVGDHAQLPSIGAGGMFAALKDKVPTAEVAEVRRAARAREGAGRRARRKERGDPRPRLRPFGRRRGDLHRGALPARPAPRRERHPRHGYGSGRAQSPLDRDQGVARARGSARHRGVQRPAAFI